MIRTQLQLTEEQYKRLRQEAASSHKSMAQQIREAIDLYLQHSIQSKTKKISEVTGKFKPISGKNLKDHDQGFAEAILASKKNAS